MADKKPKAARGYAFGILNPWGEFWGHNTFMTEAAARQYVIDYWRAFPGGCPRDVSAESYTVVPVRVTVNLRATKPSPTQGEA